MPSRSLHINFASAFDSFRIFSEKLAAFNMKKISCTSIVPFSFLNLSQVLMHDFCYNYMVSKYGSRSKLLFTDPDSLCYDVKTDDLYRDFLQELEYFDTSEYPREHFLHSVYKNVLGKMKDETHGVHIEEFIGLRRKMHSVLFTEENSPVGKKTAKAVSENVTKRKLWHQDYKSCLFEKHK